MRSHIILYALGVMLFAVFFYILYNRDALESPLGGMLIYSAVIFILALFGATSFIFGYSMRPKKR